MSSHDPTRINLRTSPEAKAMIERAAVLMGTSVSAFMLQHAY
ncbi:type II toxin-antitoxin system TacA family antitoxin, partial [Methylomagnum sp.]